MHGRVVAVLALAAAVAATALHAQSTHIPIAGRVIDAATGQPVVGAVVERDARHRVITDPDGRFVFPAIDPGQYSLRASSLGYEDARLDLDLIAGGTVTIRLSPRPISLPAVQAVARAAVPGLDRRIYARVWGREDLLSFDDVAAYHFVHEKAHLPVRPCAAGHYGVRPQTVPGMPGTSLPDWGPIGGEVTDCIRRGGRSFPVLVYVDDQRLSYTTEELYARRTWDLARVEVLTSYTDGLAMVRIFTPKYIERRAERISNLCRQLAAMDTARAGAGLWSMCSSLR